MLQSKSVTAKSCVWRFHECTPLVYSKTNQQRRLFFPPHLKVSSLTSKHPATRAEPVDQTWYQQSTSPSNRLTYIIPRTVPLRSWNQLIVKKTQWWIHLNHFDRSLKTIKTKQSMKTLLWDVVWSLVELTIQDIKLLMMWDEVKGNKKQNHLGKQISLKHWKTWTLDPSSEWSFDWCSDKSCISSSYRCCLQTL